MTCLFEGEVYEMNIAKLHKRVVGATIDLAIVIFLSIVVIYFFNSNDPYTEYDEVMRESLYKSRGFLIGLMVDFLYTTYLMQSQMQATIGMKIMGLKIIKENGNKAEFGTFFLRYFVSIFSSIFIKFGYLYAILSDKNKTVHDYAAGTIVIDEDKGPNEIFITPYENSKTASTNYSQNQVSEGYSSSTVTKNDDALWEIAIEEYDSSLRKKGLYAKIFAQKNGNESLIKAEYIKERFEQLKKELIDKKNEIILLSTSENYLQAGMYKLEKYSELNCLFFPNEECAIEIEPNKYRLYNSKQSLLQSIESYAYSSIFSKKGFLRIMITRHR
jgi:uncharacterized RDD family membrane protein YckC